ncbi:MAG: hypothetical protein WB780_21685 [Candidatus Acidiferrales bacterium]
MRGPLAGERHILELISLGAPLPGILNKLCTALDVQIGNVVSLVLVPDREENCLWSITESATQVGLHVFDSVEIFGRDKTLLATLEIYGCDPRLPTAAEYQLIERAVHLTAIALQRPGVRDDFEKPSRRSRDTMDGASERPRFIN